MKNRAQMPKELWKNRGKKSDADKLIQGESLFRFVDDPELMIVAWCGKIY